MDRENGTESVQNTPIHVDTRLMTKRALQSMGEGTMFSVNSAELIGYSHCQRGVLTRNSCYKQKSVSGIF